jgi:hypothetical protein
MSVGVRLKNTSRKDSAVDVGVELQVNHALGVLSRAQNVFGAGRPPADPPVFAPSRGLQDNLGRGHF